ncbi:hypothetical protein WICPIJ_002055 [Wickerhamomyces pijperi]|uniref:Major facilitator superfamily (MFS) profile domain-containing protein n=1 Tax=Wickerhamomyces pijperi TaxID=599730 RepID=A0A9P8Q9N9_WICPI|nr:hypothetical protein WICPIJ_002055 [Wickerhamomyces pijperi]
MSTHQFIEDIAKPNDFTEVEVQPNTNNGPTTSTNDDDDHAVDSLLSKFIAISNEAQTNESSEKSMSLMEGLRTFPKAAAWSIALSTAIIMEGYDTNLLNSLYSFPGFNQKYGEYYESLDDYQIPAKWQTSLSMAVNCGEILGLFISGVIAERFGYRRTLIGALAFTTAFIFIVFFAVDIKMLLVGEILMGVPWGMFQTLTISYASEVCPLVLRVYLTTFVNACWIIGQLLASGVLRGLLTSTNSNAYRVAFAIQWVWPIPIIIAIVFAPESPWWLVKKGRIQEAKASVKRLISKHRNLPSVSLLADAMTNRIQLTLQEEESINSNTSYWECFKGCNFRRTRVASIIWAFQNLTGSALMSYSTYFYLQAGLSSKMSFTFSIIQYVLGFLGMLTTWFLSQKLGRFTIYFGGLCVNFCILVIVGGLGCLNSATTTNTAASWAIGSLLLLFTYVYDATIGTICFCIVAEIPSSKLRTKTIIIARNVYNIAGIVVAVITPYMLNPTAWNWKAKSGFFWAGLIFIALVWSWFEFPETKGRTFAELDKLFHDGVKARDFKTTKVEVFNAKAMMEKLGEDKIKQIVNNNDTVDGGNEEEKGNIESVSASSLSVDDK